MKLPTAFQKNVTNKSDTLSGNTHNPNILDDQSRINELLKREYLQTNDTLKKHTHEHYNFRKARTVNRVPGLLLKYLLVSITSYCLIIIWSLVSLLMSGLFLYATVTLLLSGHLTVAGGAIKTADFLLGTVRATASFSSPTFKFMGLEDAVRSQEKVLAIFTLMSQSLDTTLNMFNESKALANNFLPVSSQISGDSGIYVATSLQRILSDISYIKTNVSLASAELSSLDSQNIFPFTIGFIRKHSDEAAGKLTEIKYQIIDIEKLLKVYKDMSGFGSEKTYLVLLQNSAELRPTGGFIGSVGILSLQDGTVESFTVQDVYEIDGQLKGHVDPPPLVHAFLGQEHWYLRDSNWDPDFSISAEKAAWFYEKSTGYQVDGVIAVNTLILADFLRILGPVELSDYNERITVENFFGKSLYYTQNNFFPGSTQKKDFLGSLTQALIASAQTNSSGKSVDLFKTVSKGLSEKNILLFTKNNSENSRIKEYGWAGSLTGDSGCEIEKERSVSCVNDYLYINDTNLSINKVNHFIRKQTVATVDISDDGVLDNSVTTEYENTYGDGQEGGGMYMPFVRIYIPVDTKLLSIQLNGKDIPNNNGTKKLTDIPYYTLSSDSELYQVLGVVFRVEPKSKHRLYLRYTHSGKIDFQDGRGVYELLIQKQPGQSSMPIGLGISYPNTWNVTQGPAARNNVQAIQLNESFLAKAGKLEYNGVLLQDINIKLYISL